jgi:tetratricopeptide (TPR) repeat protein
LWFEEHWGFQYYMELGGAKPLELTLSQIEPGDLLVIPSEGYNALDVPCNLVRVVDMLDYAPCPWYSTQSFSAGAGFYAATIGPFPFSAGHVNPECFYVFEFVQTLAAAAAAPGGISRTGAVADQMNLEHKAVAWLDALRSNPDDAEAHLQLAKFYASRSRMKAAAKHLAEVVRLRPDDQTARIQLALLLKEPAATDQSTK